jgi:hypothetical protein
MSEFIIQFPTLPDLLDFIEAADNRRRRINPDNCSVYGFFSDAEIELAQNGMHGKIKPV